MNYNQQQRQIINTLGGNIAVVAGAGSGKTATTIGLIEKLHLVDKIPLERMFVSTFTNKAGKEIKERIHRKFNLPYEEIEKLWIGTFHSLGFKYLTRVKKLKLSIILENEAKYYLKNIYKQVLEEDRTAEEDTPLDAVLDGIERKRNKEIPWEEACEFPEISEKVFNFYQKEKKEQNILDFTDILTTFEKTLQEDTLFRSKFSWVFVDEVQDNCLAQVRIAELLTNKNQVLVGDNKQSIYGFRGAAPHLFKEKIKQATTVYPLANNYRSSKDIIDFANVLLDQAPQFSDQKLVSTKPSFFKPVFTICDDQAINIFNSIREDLRNGIPHHEIAVIARSIKPLSIQNLTVLLRKNNIPYVLRGGDDKLNSTYVQNYLSLLKTLVKPTKISMLNTLSFLPGVGPKTAMALSDKENALNFDLSTIKGQTSKYAQTRAYNDFVKLLDLCDKKEILMGGLDFIHDHYLVPKYSKKDPKDPGMKKSLIFDLLYKYLDGYPSISEGIDSLYVNEDDMDADKGKVVISTIHQIKGLEFDSVYIANLNELGIPYIKEDEEKDLDRLEEEFCLMYVACTRARKYLRMYMQFMSGQGDWARTNKVSRYIKEMFKAHKEKYFRFRVLDVENEETYKEMLWKKVNGK